MLDGPSLRWLIDPPIIFSISDSKMHFINILPDFECLIPAILDGNRQSKLLLIFIKVIRLHSGFSLRTVGSLRAKRSSGFLCPISINMHFGMATINKEWKMDSRRARQSGPAIHFASTRNRTHWETIHSVSIIIFAVWPGEEAPGEQRAHCLLGKSVFHSARAIERRIRFR